MKKIFEVFVLLAFTFSFAQKKIPKISVIHNKNIETYFFAEKLSADHQKIKDFECYKIKEYSVCQPVVKNAEIAFSTAKINDLLTEKLFPETVFL